MGIIGEVKQAIIAETIKNLSVSARLTSGEKKVFESKIKENLDEQFDSFTAEDLAQLEIAYNNVGADAIASSFVEQWNLNLRS